MIALEACVSSLKRLGAHSPTVLAARALFHAYKLDYCTNAVTRVSFRRYEGYHDLG